MKPYLISLLMLISNSVWADWVEVQSTSSGINFYIDFASVKVEGTKRKAWELKNFSTLQSVGGYDYWSMRSRVEFDCKDERYRILTLTAFSKLNADGNALMTHDEPTKWVDLAPYTAGLNILKMVCKITANSR